MIWPVFSKMTDWICYLIRFKFMDQWLRYSWTSHKQKSRCKTGKMETKSKVSVQCGSWKGVCQGNCKAAQNKRAQSMKITCASRLLSICLEEHRYKSSLDSLAVNSLWPAATCILWLQAVTPKHGVWKPCNLH